MNVERLHSLLLDVIEDIEETSTSELLSELRNWTQRLADNPQDPNIQREFSSRRAQLMDALTEAASNTFSPGIASDLDELGISRLLGNTLASQIEEVFSQNEFTLAVASDQITEIEQEVIKLSESLGATVEAFDDLAIGKDEPAPGIVEASVTLPRSSIDNSLELLGTELHQLERIFADVTELATGSRPPTTVRSIAASDFSIYVQLATEAAALLTLALERVIALYKKLLEIRRIRSEAAAQGISNEDLEGIDEHINSHMDRGLDDVVDQLFDEVQIKVSDRSRQNELRISLKRTLTHVAARIDRGYRFDIRIGPLMEVSDDEEDDEVRSSRTAAISTIVEHREGLQFLQLEGESILQLPSPASNNR